MPFTLTQLTSATSATGAQYDQNNQLLGAVAPMPCTVAGTNTITLTQQTAGSGSIATTIAITAYQNGMQFCGIASATNTGATTAAVGSLAALPVYKPSPGGPVVLAGGEFVIGCAFTLAYDSALNGGNGGFHLMASLAAIAGMTITPRLVKAVGGIQVGATTNPTLVAILNAQATLAFSALVPNATQDATFIFTGASVTDRFSWLFPIPVSAGLQLQGYFAGGNSVQATMNVRVSNVTAASTITPGTVTVGAMALRVQ